MKYATARKKIDGMLNEIESGTHAWILDNLLCVLTEIDRFDERGLRLADILRYISRGDQREIGMIAAFADRLTQPQNE